MLRGRGVPHSPLLTPATTKLRAVRPMQAFHSAHRHIGATYLPLCTVSSSTANCTLQSVCFSPFVARDCRLNGTLLEQRVRKAARTMAAPGGDHVLSDDFEVPGVQRVVATREARQPAASAVTPTPPTVPSPERSGSARSGTRPSSSRNLRGTYSPGNLPARTPITHAEADLAALPVSLGGSPTRRVRGAKGSSPSAADSKTGEAAVPGRLGGLVEGTLSCTCVAELVDATPIVSVCGQPSRRLASIFCLSPALCIFVYVCFVASTAHTSLASRHRCWFVSELENALGSSRQCATETGQADSHGHRRHWSAICARWEGFRPWIWPSWPHHQISHSWRRSRASLFQTHLPPAGC